MDLNQLTRDLEFTQKGVPRAELIAALEALIPIIRTTLEQLPENSQEAPFPRFFDDKEVTVSYVLVTLLAHINYHLGQVNYLRRLLH
ncbi:DinB family protein [Deminuibacter soli]|uniref:DinB family protein n=1 Tax=Deminuibacter soli TaxID=2291815 RepID=UPI001314BFD1|nr:DinB family protein [Deminuibacter soli]